MRIGNVMIYSYCAESWASWWIVWVDLGLEAAGATYCRLTSLSTSSCLPLADVLSEEAILKWYNESHLAKGKSVFLEQMKQFVEWLKNAEEGKRPPFPRQSARGGSDFVLMASTLSSSPRVRVGGWGGRLKTRRCNPPRSLWFLRREQREQDAVERFLKRESFQKFPSVFPYLLISYSTVT